MSFYAQWNVPWRTRTVLLALLASTISLYVVGFLVGVYVGISYHVFGVGELPSGGELSASQLDPWLILQMLSFLFWTWLLVLRPHKLSLRDLFRQAPAEAGAVPAPGQPRHTLAEDIRHGSRFFFILLGLAIVLLVITVAVIWMVASRHGQVPADVVAGYFEETEREKATVITPDISWLRLLLIVLPGPLIEEVVFRGCLFASLRKRMGFWGSALISAGVFAIVHQQYVVGLPGVVLIGLTCAFLFERTRSLRAAVILHACWNLFSVFVTNPVMALPVLTVGGGIWFWARRPSAPISKRTGWKWYAVILTLVMVAGYSLDAKILWQAVFEIPVLTALFCYAWKRSVGTPAFWRNYTLGYLVWIVWLLCVNSIPEASLQPWQRVFVSSEPIRSTSDLLIEVIGYTLFMGPALVAMWRLGQEMRPSVPRT